MIRIAAPLALTAAALAIAPAALAAEVDIEAQGPVIELNIYETVEVEPDMATIGAGVSTEAPTAVAALRQNSVEMQRVIERIKSLGVKERDIQTTGINLNPRYDYDRTSQRQIFRGYQASNRVSVKLRKIEETGAVLDALVAAGATDLSGPSFSVEDDTAAKDAARDRAMERARERAMAYARLAGYPDIKLLSVSETIQARTPSPMVMRTAAVEDVQVAAAPVQPGLVGTGVSLSLTYEMVGRGD